MQAFFPRPIPVPAHLNPLHGDGDRRGDGRRRRKPTLAGMLKAASKAGQHVTGAVIEDGKVRLIFGEPSTSTSAPGNPWDAEIARLTQ